MHAWRRKKRYPKRLQVAGYPRGVEVVAHSLRDCLDKHTSSKLGLLKIDFKNAFNMVDRSHFVKSVPAMSKWTECAA